MECLLNLFYEFEIFYNKINGKVKWNKKLKLNLSYYI